MYRKFVKRFFDIVIAIILLVLFSPILILVSICLSIINKGTPIFFQSRPGKEEKIFKIFKFKTMTDEKNKQGQLLPDSKRLTKIGRFIRKTSFDELPQLINVIKGDMSLIGPRPLLVEYLTLYNDFQKRRHEVKPGITGWTQVNGRNAISWLKKFELDVWYVDNLSFALDCKIAWMTIVKVIKSEGISQKGEATMEFFKGKV